MHLLQGEGQHKQSRLILHNRRYAKSIKTRGYKPLSTNSIMQITLRKSLIYMGFIVLRIFGYEPRGRGFNSCQPHHTT